MRDLLFLISLLAALAPAAARADRKEAADRYRKGVALYKEGDYGAALAEFRAAYNAQPTFEVLYNIGLTERRLFKYGAAVKDLNRYLEEGGKKVPKDRRENVQKELDQISGLTAVVTVTVSGGPAKVVVDGEAMGLSPLAEVILLGSGSHTFRAERADFVPDEKTVEVVSRTKLAVQLAPKKKEDTVPAEVNVDSSPKGAVITIDGKLAGLAPTHVQLAPGGHDLLAELDGWATTHMEVVVAAGQARTVLVAMEPLDKQAGRPKRFPLVGVVVGGAGLATLGGGIALALAAGSDAKKTSALFASGGAWTSDAAAVQSAGLAKQTWAWVLMVTGAAAVATGAVLAILSLTASNDETESALWLAPAPLGLTFGWSWR